MFDNFSLDNELEVLKSFMPAALKEGALLVEFKENLDQDISKASVLTLNEEETVGSMPEENQDDCGTWCFNLKRRYWMYQLLYTLKLLEKQQCHLRCFPNRGLLPILCL